MRAFNACHQAQSGERDSGEREKDVFLLIFSSSSFLSRDKCVMMPAGYGEMKTEREKKLMYKNRPCMLMET